MPEAIGSVRLSTDSRKEKVWDKYQPGGTRGSSANSSQTSSKRQQDWRPMMRIISRVGMALATIVLILASCSSPYSKIEGYWMRGGTGYLFFDGFIFQDPSTEIWGTYRFVDKNTIELDREDTYYLTLIKVAYPNAQTMQWYRLENDKQIRYWRFKKPSPRN